MKFRTSGNIRNPVVFQAIRDILFESPELSNNSWLSHRAEMIEIIENENARAPPLAYIFEDESVANHMDERSLIDLLLDEMREKTMKTEEEND